MSSRLLENIINTKIKSDLNTVFYDLIVKHVVTSNVAADLKLSLRALNL